MVEEKKQASGEAKLDYVEVTNLIGQPAYVKKEYVENSRFQIGQVKAQQEICRTCSGETCRQPIPGMMPLLTSYRGCLYFPLTPCPRKKLRERKIRIQERRQEANLPSLFQGKTFADYQLTDGNRLAVRMAQRLVRQKDPGKGLYLYGSRGTGKTLLATIVGNLLVQQGQRVLFTDTAQLRCRFRENLKHPDDPDRSLETADCLIIDDLGSERFNAWGLEQLARVIDIRYRQQKLTLVTSNDSLKTLGEKMAQVRGNAGKQDAEVAARIVSRLAGMTVPLPFYGLDRRWGAENARIHRSRQGGEGAMELFGKA